MYKKEKIILVNDVNVYRDKTTKELKGIVVYYENGERKLFLSNEQQVSDFFGLQELPKTDNDLKELRTELREKWIGKKIFKIEVISEFADFDTH